MIQELAFTLVCLGVSDVAATESISGDAGTASIERRARADDRMTVEVSGNVVRVRAPMSLEPEMAGRGTDGWRTLTEASITDREIRGVLRYSWINTPAVVINRMTGEITVRKTGGLAGRSGFVGTCERVAADTQRF